MKFPIQPTYIDEHGVKRFKENKVVSYLLANGGLDLNYLRGELNDCHDDWEQFAQLIGYSVSGFSDLPYVSEETLNVLGVVDCIEAGDVSEDKVRLEYLRSVLYNLKDSAVTLAEKIQEIYPEDLKEVNDLC